MSDPLDNFALPDLDNLDGSLDFGLPDLEHLGEQADTEPDPLAHVEYTGDLAEDSAREIDALDEGYRDRAKREAERFRLATDSEYWFAVCFESRAEKESFLAKLGALAELGDKYIDGRQLAKKLHIQL